MRVPWKLIGLAGLAGVAASGAIVVRRRRHRAKLEPDELRRRLHRRLVEAREREGAAGGSAVNLRRDGSD